MRLHKQRCSGVKRNMRMMLIIDSYNLIYDVNHLWLPSEDANIFKCTCKVKVSRTDFYRLQLLEQIENVIIKVITMYLS